jgi:hypothetical protein
MTVSFSRFAHVRIVAVALTMLAGIAAAVPPSRIDVDWTNPADFSEARAAAGSPVGRQSPEAWLGDLAARLRQRADRQLPPGQHLAVTFTDVRRAGILEPWRGPEWNDIRVIKDQYPPSIDLRFVLTDATGATLREGERRLRDVSFLSRSVAFRQDDPLRYEKRMLDDWVQREFAAPRRGVGAATGASS